MKRVHRILQPSCSELCTHLNLRDIKEIRATLKEVEKITGWEIGLHRTVRYNAQKPLSKNKWGVLFKKINIDNLELVNDKLGIPTNRLSSNDMLYVDFFNSNQPDPYVSVELYNSKTNAYLYIRMGDGYSGNYGLTFLAEQHCVTRDFPALAKIIRHFNSDWTTYDGGSPEDFKDWCVNNKYEDVAEKYPY